MLVFYLLCNWLLWVFMSSSSAWMFSESYVPFLVPKPKNSLRAQPCISSPPTPQSPTPSLFFYPFPPVNYQTAVLLHIALPFFCHVFVFTQRLPFHRLLTQRVLRWPCWQLFLPEVVNGPSCKLCSNDVGSRSPSWELSPSGWSKSKAALASLELLFLYSDIPAGKWNDDLWAPALRYSSEKLFQGEVVILEVETEWSTLHQSNLLKVLASTSQLLLLLWKKQIYNSLPSFGKGKRKKIQKVPFPDSTSASLISCIRVSLIGESNTS